jgi:anti-sigma28 factor (negative regulator of flagellin synthesis)
MKILSIFILTALLISGCSKMEEKKTGEDTKTPDPRSAPSTTKENNNTTENKSGSENKTSTDKKSDGQTDDKAIELSAAADKSYSAYESDKSETNKKAVIEKCLDAGNYLMFDADLPAKEKYRPALKYYRMVLEADPSNEEAIKNKTEIERIYESMGMPIPK